MARNAVPIVGVTLLGWNAPTLVLFYFVDTTISLGLLFYYRHPDDPTATEVERSNAAKATVFFGLMFGAWGVIPVFGHGGVLWGWPLAGAVVAQAVASWIAMTANLRRDGWRKDIAMDRFKRRLGFVAGRWVVSVLTGIMLPAITVIVYAVMTVAYQIAIHDEGAP